MGVKQECVSRQLSASVDIDPSDLGTVQTKLAPCTESYFTCLDCRTCL